MRLLIDSGNSRLKWAKLPGTYCRAQAFAEQGVLDWSRRGALRAFTRLLRTLEPPTSLYVCNVAGAAVQRSLATAVADAGLAKPCFVRTGQRFGDLRNGYREAWRLGADRWVALIGAMHEYPGHNLCVIGLGTALTADLVEANGTHHGGCIVPGPQLMISALLDRTAGIRARAAGVRGAAAAMPASPFARDTRHALLAGSGHACAALIERAVRAARAQLRSRVELIVGGGAADAVGVLLSTRFRRNDELVLRGLAVIAQSATASASRPAMP